MELVIMHLDFILFYFWTLRKKDENVITATEKSFMQQSVVQSGITEENENILKELEMLPK